jgi:hypothetical protein
MNHLVNVVRFACLVLLLLAPSCASDTWDPDRRTVVGEAELVLEFDDASKARLHALDEGEQHVKLTAIWAHARRTLPPAIFPLLGRHRLMIDPSGLRPCSVLSAFNLERFMALGWTADDPPPAPECKKDSALTPWTCHSIWIRLRHKVTVADLTFAYGLMSKVTYLPESVVLPPQDRGGSGMPR